MESAFCSGGATSVSGRGTSWATEPVGASGPPSSVGAPQRLGAAVPAAAMARGRPTAGAMEMPELKTQVVVPTGPVGATAWQTQISRPRRCRFWTRRNPRCRIHASRVLSFHAGGQPRIHQRGETASKLKARAPTKPKQAAPPGRKAIRAPRATHCSVARIQYWAEVASGGRASHCGLLAP